MPNNLILKINMLKSTNNFDQETIRNGICHSGRSRTNYGNATKTKWPALELHLTIGSNQRIISTKKRYAMAFFWSTVWCMDAPLLAVRPMRANKNEQNHHFAPIFAQRLPEKVHG